MKVAVIGCGTIANAAHIPSYMNNPEAEIKYFCDIIPERAEAAVEKYGCGKAVVDYHDVLADPEVEAVSVCTPNNVHPTITIDALRAGKNVLCEKPAARTYKEALEMQKVQHETGKVLNIGVVNRFNDSVNLIKKYIDDGKLGDVYHVYASFRAHRSIGPRRRLHDEGNRRRRRADRLGRPLPRHRHVLLRRPEGQDRHGRSVQQARRRHEGLRLQGHGQARRSTTAFTTSTIPLSA